MLTILMKCIGATTRTPVDRSHQGGDGMANVTHSHSVSWLPLQQQIKQQALVINGIFKLMEITTQVAGNPYNYKAAPYAKKGKLIRKYATGQEIKNYSKGKRFGPPPLKGPDPQGLQVVLENSDYFKKLIG